MAGPGLTLIGAAAPDPDQFIRRMGTISETTRSNGRLDNLSTFLTSQRLHLVKIDLPKNKTFSKIRFVSGTQAMVTPANVWYVLTTKLLVPVAFTTDEGAAGPAWAANNNHDISLATGPDGVAAKTSHTTGAADDWGYLGILVNAATPPSLVGAITIGGPPGNSAPVLTGTSSTGRTTIASLIAVLSSGAIPNAPAGSTGIPHASLVV